MYRYRGTQRRQLSTRGKREEVLKQRRRQQSQIRLLGGNLFNRQIENERQFQRMRLRRENNVKKTD